ncbi:hypothetical protein CEXT_611831 [Caerostris extrusa]|uniref:Uncharacterized protein n=1 Tax=Caerostris extrusa TaxID=172846 RepID=A0AAV4U118_CAEEX|nr:hypothetical protein CEXT_611831 [Caerostris extrusa]
MNRNFIHCPLNPTSFSDNRISGFMTLYIACFDVVAIESVVQSIVEATSLTAVTFSEKGTSGPPEKAFGKAQKTPHDVSLSYTHKGSNIILEVFSKPPQWRIPSAIEHKIAALNVKIFFSEKESKKKN